MSASSSMPGARRHLTSPRRGHLATGALLATALVIVVGLVGLPSAAASKAPASSATTDRAPAFDVIALGTSGGIVEDDLTAYLIGRAGRARFVLADAGTVVAGLRRAEARGALDDIPPSERGSRAERAQQERISTILITHPHLDHVSGLVIASPDDDKHVLAALPSTIDALKRDLFNNRTWVNFLDEGERPLSKYQVARMEPGAPLLDEKAGLRITAWPLSHAGMTSTAFALETEGGDLALFFGDTGPDSVEKEGRLHALWERIAPVARAGKLRVVVIEVSYPNGRADKLLFGHLTPDHLHAELATLARLVDDSRPDALRGLPVVVSHVKPTVGDSAATRARIARELDEQNTLGVRFVHLTQGERASF